MRLVSLSITNYRSITKAHKIPIADSTVVLGKNNEGKSNVLRALDAAIKTLKLHARHSAINDRYFYAGQRDVYVWRRDFPISLQERSQGTESIFRLEFQLDDQDIADFKTAVKSNLNGSLPIEIRIGRTNVPQISVPKKGPGGTSLSKKSASIAAYIGQKIDFVYIPAVRTEGEALSVVQEILAGELASLEQNKDYVAAISAIAKIQQPVLDRVSKTIEKSLKQFLPSINDVSVTVPAHARLSALRAQCRIEIDDGSKTLLEYKGDGVKSLAALSLLTGRKRKNTASIVAIEEPESHLHPGAIHALREVIDGLTDENQVVITSHCPLFVDRYDVSRNIIIDSNSAQPARDISEIRTLLGIKASDNLVSANIVLLTEGSTDALALRSLLPELDPLIQRAMKKRHVVIEHLGGSGNLTYKISTLTNALCVTHVLLDGDAAGKTAFDAAESAGQLKLADTTFINCIGMREAELEDCYEESIYSGVIKSEYQVDLSHASFKTKGKWSDRMKNAFLVQGKAWDARIEKQVKTLVAKQVVDNATNSLNVHRRTSIDALVKNLSELIEKDSNHSS